MLMTRRLDCTALFTLVVLYYFMSPWKVLIAANVLLLFFRKVECGWCGVPCVAVSLIRRPSGGGVCSVLRRRAGVVFLSLCLFDPVRQRLAGSLSSCS